MFSVKGQDSIDQSTFDKFIVLSERTTVNLFDCYATNEIVTQSHGYANRVLF